MPPRAGDEVLRSTHNRSAINWDSWAKQLIAILNKAMLYNKGVDTTSMPDGGNAEQPVVEGALMSVKGCSPPVRRPD